MRYIKKYKKFLESIEIDLNINPHTDILESMSIWHDTLLTTINAEEVDPYSTLHLDKDRFNLDIQHLSNMTEFINSLSSLGLKKSTIESTDDYETYVNKPCKFMLIYKIESNELENPEYILIQTWNETLGEWSDTKLYKVNDDIKKFYDKLTSKTMEIVDGDINYIYTTSNGNEWVLQNDRDSDTFVKVIRQEDMDKILKDNKVKIQII
jgi:hypothetical protein